MKILLTICSIVAFLTISIITIDSGKLRNWVADVTMPIRHNMHRDRNIMVEMRDGIHLATTIYRPLTKKTFHPTILIRTTYAGYDFSWIKYFVKNGYAVVVQHVRGRYGSEGDIYSPHRYSRSDGYDTIDWIVNQKWSTDKVGTFGCSFLGESQIILAAAKHPSHIAMITDGAGGAIGKAKESYGYFGVYENGVLNLASSLGWFTSHGAIHHKITPRPDNYKERLNTEIKGLPIDELAQRMVPYKTGFDDLVGHKLTDSWWDKEGYINNDDYFSTAALHVNTWYDQTVHDTFRLAKHMAENATHPRAQNQHLLIDPGLHCSASELSEGLVKIGELEIQYKSLDFKQIYLNWFDYWLKGKKVDLPPRYQYFVINTGKWQTSTQWPPKNVVPARYYLHADGQLDQSRPNPTTDPSHISAVDSFIYDPLDPVPTIGGSICCTGEESDIAGPRDQSSLKKRKDVLIYSSEQLKADLDLVGNAKAILYVSTSAKDTDFTLKIVDHQPDGKAYNLQDGIIRLRYRNRIDKPQLANPGEIYRVELKLRPIAYRFKKGHKIEVYLSSSNFPRLARNLNTGEDEYKSKATIVAKNSIYRTNTHASYIELPLVTE